MKIVIQNRLYDLSLVYSISTLYDENDQWKFYLSFISLGESQSIWLSSGRDEYRKVIRTNPPLLKDYLNYIQLPENEQLIYKQLAEKKSRELYNKVLLEWAESKQSLPFPTFNLE